MILKNSLFEMDRLITVQNASSFSSFKLGARASFLFPKGTTELIRNASVPLRNSDGFSSVFLVFLWFQLSLLFHKVFRFKSPNKSHLFLFFHRKIQTKLSVPVRLVPHIGEETNNSKIAFSYICLRWCSPTDMSIQVMGIHAWKSLNTPITPHFDHCTRLMYDF